MGDDRCDLLCLDLPRAEQVRQHRLGAEEAALLAGRARALGDPTRLMLAAALADAGELCVCDLSWIAERSTNLVSHHLRALRAEGVVQSRREARLVIYRLTPAGLALLCAVLASRSEPAR